MFKFKMLFNNVNKNILILKTTCLFWLLTKLFSWRIWTTNRLLPTVPVFGFFDHIPAIVHTALFVISILLLALAFFNENKYLFSAILITEILLCLLDQNRLLSWEYLYAFIIIVFLINDNTPEYIFPNIILILASTYFYSGVCKLDESFVHIVWSNMILHTFLKIPVSIINQTWLYYMGYMLGSIELLLGIGLLINKTRLVSIVLLVFLHLFILSFLGPFGLRGYRVLWPWNLSMILFLLIIPLYGVQKVGNIKLITKGWNKLVILCWVILPAFSFWGLWDRNLSSNLFSANIPRMIICVNDTSKCRELKRFMSNRDIAGTCKGKTKINLQAWAMIETGVTAYPEIRTYHVIQKKLEEEYGTAGLSFVFLDR
jgi:hypothetical protein